MAVRGSCHCGRIRFEVEGTPDGALSCNCSICSRRGSLLWFVPREHLHMLTPDDAAGTYMFNEHVIRHRFCPVCGIHTHGEGQDPQGTPIAAVNIRVLEDFDFSAVPVQAFDGRSA